MTSALPPEAPQTIALWITSIFFIVAAIAVALKSTTKLARRRTDQRDSSGLRPRPTGLYIAAAFAVLAGLAALASEARILALMAAALAVKFIVDSRRW